MTGISEILVLVLLITCILILPRLFKGEPRKKDSSVKKINRLPVKIRSGIVVSILYPLAAALYFKPWNENIIPFISIGVIPVFLIWAIVWIMAGKKDKMHSSK